MAAMREAPDIEIVGASAVLHDALHLAEKARPDVIVLGIEESGAPGIETATQLRVNIPDAAVIVLAAPSDGPLLLEALDRGCSALVTKGRSINDLVGAIKAAAKGDLTFPLTMLGRVINRSQNHSARSELTSREREILRLLAAGETTTAISESLALSSHTVRNHISNLLTKLCVHSRLEAVLVAQRLGLIAGDTRPSCL